MHIKQSWPTSTNNWHLPASEPIKRPRSFIIFWHGMQFEEFSGYFSQMIYRLFKNMYRSFNFSSKAKKKKKENYILIKTGHLAHKVRFQDEKIHI